MATVYDAMIDQSGETVTRHRAARGAPTAGTYTDRTVHTDSELSMVCVVGPYSVSSPSFAAWANRVMAGVATTFDEVAIFKSDADIQEFDWIVGTNFSYDVYQLHEWKLLGTTMYKLAQLRRRND